MTTDEMIEALSSTIQSGYGPKEHYLEPEEARNIIAKLRAADELVTYFKKRSAPGMDSWILIEAYEKAGASE